MKRILVTQFKRYSALVLSVGFALSVLLIRIQMTYSLFYVFLVWNLVLATVPYAITQYLKFRSAPSKLNVSAILSFCLWLLFLPNSPYIITDLVHLHNDSSHLIWLDLFLVFVFALNGLLLGLLSLMDMFRIIGRRYGLKVASTLMFFCCLLSGYGVYLGRFLRFNSWDALTKPILLFQEIAASLSQPKVWLMSGAFGGLLWTLFLLMQSLTSKTSMLNKA